MLWCPNEQGLHSIPLKWSNDQLWCHGIPYIDNNPLERNLHKSESLAVVHKKNELQLKVQQIERGENTQEQM
jgi:hypothetical protein